MSSKKNQSENRSEASQPGGVEGVAGAANPNPTTARLSDEFVVAELTRRIAELENRLDEVAAQKAPRQSHRLQRIGLGLAVGALLAVGATLAAAQAACIGNGELCVFSANSPARADEVNHNFALLKQWVEEKVNTVGSADVLLRGELRLDTNTDLFVNNRLGQRLNLWDTGYGLGIQGGTLYSRTDANFAWFLGGTHHDGAMNSGGGTTLMTLNETELNVTVPLKQEGQTVIRRVTSCCRSTAGNCCVAGYTSVGPDLNQDAGGDYCYLCVDYANN
jgi:hypothetical protein